MKISRYCYLATLAGLSDAFLPKVPPELMSATPAPLENAALWQEAVAFDARIEGNVWINRLFYSTQAFFQSVENSSIHYAQFDVLDASGASAGLQAIRSYPVEYHQAQAADPASTIGKADASPRLPLRVLTML